MDLKLGLQKLEKRYKDLTSSPDEKNTENWFILPFLKVLGYDHSNPDVIQAQYRADSEYKRTGKVDYAIFDKNREPIIYVECKQLREPLHQHRAQLKNYFNTSPSVKFAILTNGVEYRFFSDLDRENMMDQKPFLSFDLETDTNKYLRSLSAFTRQNFNVSEARSLALTLSYRSKILEYLKREMRKPSDDLVSFITKNIFGTTKKAVRDKIKPILPSIFDEIMNGDEPIIIPPDPLEGITRKRIKSLGDEPEPIIISPPPGELINIFDIPNPQGIKLEYYVFDGKKYTDRVKVTDMFVTIYEYLFQINRDLASNHKGSPVKSSRPNHRHVDLGQGYFLHTNLSNISKFKNLKDALTEFHLEDALYLKLVEK